MARRSSAFCWSLVGRVCTTNSWAGLSAVLTVFRASVARSKGCEYIRRRHGVVRGLLTAGGARYRRRSGSRRQGSCQYESIRRICRREARTMNLRCDRGSAGFTLDETVCFRLKRRIPPSRSAFSRFFARTPLLNCDWFDRIGHHDCWLGQSLSAIRPPAFC
jgi:hypothetical protein